MNTCTIYVIKLLLLLHILSVIHLANVESQAMPYMATYKRVKTM